MAGTLTISTLSDGTNSTSSTNCIQGSAKAWVNFNGTTGAIRTNYNVSSVTRNSTGAYTIAYTNALTDANYVAIAQTPTANQSNFVMQSGVEGNHSVNNSTPFNKTAAQCNIVTGASTTPTDANEVYYVVFR